ncbi:MAG: radical SAM protein [Dehalococcoidales bacterium]|nr:radical SAM protein [Dehalococcoidales bacterium]
MAEFKTRRRVKSPYNPPSLIFNQTLSVAYHGWLTNWEKLPGWMLKGKKVMETAAGATAIGCTGYPYHVVWEVTTRCNLDCIHCYASAAKARQEELTTAEGKRLLEQIAEVDEMRMIVVTGGEPLLRNDIYELIEHAGKLGLRIVFSTNGTLLTPVIAKDLARLGVVNFSISLDGYTSQCHENIRRVPGSFQGAINGLKAAATTGVCVQANFTAMKQNLKELPGMIDLAEDLNSDIIMVFQVIQPPKDGVALELEKYEQLWLIKTLASKQKKSKALIIPVCCPEYWPWLIEQKRLTFGKKIQQAALKGCGAGSGFSYIRFDGDVWPCNFIPVVAGNVKQKSFTEIWNNSPLLKQFRVEHRGLKGVCGACEYQQICGGCRGRAHAHTGDSKASDPLCFFNE